MRSPALVLLGLNRAHQKQEANKSHRLGHSLALGDNKAYNKSGPTAIDDPNGDYQLTCLSSLGTTLCRPTVCWWQDITKQDWEGIYATFYVSGVNSSQATEPTALRKVYVPFPCVLCGCGRVKTRGRRDQPASFFPALLLSSEKIREGLSRSGSHSSHHRRQTFLRIHHGDQIHCSPALPPLLAEGPRPNKA